MVGVGTTTVHRLPCALLGGFESLQEARQRGATQGSPRSHRPLNVEERDTYRDRYRIPRDPERLGAHRGAVEQEQAPALEDTVDDGGGQIVVVQHSAPGFDTLFVSAAELIEDLSTASRDKSSTTSSGTAIRRSGR